ncbi:MAG: hypothetical protein KA368_12380 [Acidobacteria bacterium]|nr:hypothetical protein [Acidobacteriota bacterium]
MAETQRARTKSRHDAMVLFALLLSICVWQKIQALIDSESKPSNIPPTCELIYGTPPTPFDDNDRQTEPHAWRVVSEEP